MDKVYLLLRNNRQTGPYLLQELVQQPLLPNDLIWVEGKSMGWLYPAEYKELRPYIKPANEIVTPVNNDISHHHIVPPSTVKSSKHIYVSLPVPHSPNSHTTSPEKSLEQQAEDLRKKVEAYAAAHSSIKNNGDQPPAYIPKNISDLQKDYTTWLHQQMQKKKNRFYKRTGVAVFILLLLSGGGYILAKDGLMTKETAALPVNHILKSEAAQSAKNNSHPIRQNSAPEIIVPDTMATETDIPVALSGGKNSKPTKQPVATVKMAVPIATHTENTEEADRPPLLADDIKVPAIQEGIKDPAITATSNNTLGKKISRLFKKHKRQDDDKSMVNDWSSKADVTFTSNTSGTQSLQLTLHNRSGDTIKAAIVEVRYYNKQNDIIEKQLVHFKNVLPGDTAIQAVTGSRLTDHIYYQLLSADNETGKVDE